MQNNYTWYIAIVIAFVAGYLFGGQQMEQNQQSDKTAQMDEDSMTSSKDAMMEDDKTDGEMKSSDAMMQQDDAIRLTGSAPAEGGVELEWTLADGVEEPEKFVLVRGDEENPIHDGAHFWYRVAGNRRAATWRDSSFKEGSYNFRICILEDDDCIAYSNNIELSVKAPN